MFDKSLETGIDVIDDEHKVLFEVIDDLQKVSLNNTKFWETLIVLENYVNDHFATEERYMRNLEYPFYESHKKSHEEFSLNYKKFLEKISKADDIMQLSDELVLFIKEWIEDHYTKHDIKMAEFLKKNIRNEYKL